MTLGDLQNAYNLKFDALKAKLFDHRRPMSHNQSMGRQTQRIVFEMIGQPVSWKRAAGKGLRRFDPKTQKDLKRKWLSLAIRAAVDADFMPRKEEYLTLEVVCKFKGLRTADVDNLAKLIMDALEPRIAHNDRMFDELIVRAEDDCDDPKTVVMISRNGRVRRGSK